MSEQYRKDNLGFEIDKLSKQIKLLQELDKLYSEQKDKTLSVQRSVENTTKIMELQRKLEQQGIKNIQNQNDLNEKSAELDRLRAIKWDERLRIEQSITKAQKEELQNQEKLNKKEEELSKKKDDRARRQARNEIDGYRNQSKTLELKKQIAKLEEESFLKDKAKKTSTKMEHLENNKKINALKKELELQTKIENVKSNSEKSIKNSKNSFVIPGLGSIGSLKEFSELNTSAKLFSVASKTFNTAVNTFTSIFTQGMNTVANKANSQFHNISTMTGMSYGTYRNGIGGMGNRLRNWNGYNLQDNIKTSDVQDAMNSLASAGVSRENLLSNAVENAITNTIVPYLDTQSENFILLNERIGGDFSKQIRGISKANIEIAGNNLATKDILNSMIDLVKPMSDEALENLAKGSTEVSAMVNKLMKEQGWSKENAEAYATSMFKYQKYGASQLAGASTSDKLKYYNILHSGYDLGDLNNANNIMGIALDTDMRLMGMTPGYGDNISRLQSNTFADAMGIDYNYRQQLYSSNKKGLSGSVLAKSTDLTNAQFNNYGNQATKELANGDTQTPEEKQLTQLENLSTEVAMWKVDSGLWFDTLTTAVKGIAMIIGAKLIGGIGKGLLGIGGKAVGGGIVGSALTSFAGTGVGYNLMGSGAALGINSVPAATAAGIAGVAAGGAMAIKGGSDVIKDFKNNNVTGKTALSGVGAAAGVAGAGLLLASNPIGWAVLLAGGAGLAARALIEHAEAEKKAMHDTGDIMDKLKEQSTQELTQYKMESRQKVEQLETIKERLERTDNLEAQKQILVEAGIASDKELQKEQYNNKTALMALTNQYIASTKQETEELDKTREELYRNRDELLSDASKGIFSMKNAGYDNLSEDQKAALPELARQYYAYLEANKDKNKDMKWRYDKINEKIQKGIINLNDDITSQADYDAIFWLGGVQDQVNVWEQMTQDKSFMQGLNNSNYGYSIRKGIGMDYGTTLDYNYAAEQLQAALNVNTKESAQSIMTNLARMGFTRDNLKSGMLDQVLAKYPDISFRVGTDYIPYDNYPALLHEGEAVLTASTANDLRGLIDEYRETKSNNIRITQAIENQTEALIAKLDAIYTKMPGNDESNAKDTMPGRLMQNVKQMTLPFN